jgi:hypothetical protein
VDELVDEFAVALFPVAAAAAFPTFLCHILFPYFFPEARLMMIRLASWAAGSEKIRS